MKKISIKYKKRKLVAAIGIFDGVHRGHEKILRRLVKEAKTKNLKSLVITFHPHPRNVLNPKKRIPLLTSLKHRLKLIESLGIDFFLIIKFTKRVSRMKADEFLKKVLLPKFNIKAIVVGRNFLFGCKRSGSFSSLQRISKRQGFQVYGIEPVKMGISYISSTRIRKAIEKGELRDAAMMLQRPVTVLGTVVKGRKVGRILGFPTANIDPHHEAIPPSGVYIVNVKIDKRLYKAVLNIGKRPTFRSGEREPTIELHILNFKRNIYGKDVEVIFRRKIRNERRFSSVEALRKQIRKDILTVKQSPPISSISIAAVTPYIV